MAVEDRPDDALRRLRSMATGGGPCCDCPAPAPFLAVLGRAPEAMGWGTEPERVLPFLPPGGRCEILDDVGHFVHIEQPDLVAGWCSNTWELRHEWRCSQRRARCCATTASISRCTRCGPVTAVRCCCCTVSVSARRRLCHGGWTGGRDRSPRSTSPATATRRSRPAVATRRRLLLADADAALAALGQSNRVRPRTRRLHRAAARRARPADVIGAVLTDGPGLAGGATFPTSELLHVAPDGRSARSVRPR